MTLLCDDISLLKIDTRDETNLCMIRTTGELSPLETAGDTAAKDSPPTENSFLLEQAHDTYCKIATLQRGHTSTEFHVDHHGLLFRKSAIDEAIQNVVPEYLRSRILYVSHYPSIAGLPGQRRMYDSLRQAYYWIHMATDVYTTTAQCTSCARNGNQYRHRR